jgi:hypothetical protein
MPTRRIACIESELLRCERELRGLLVDARGVLQSGESRGESDKITWDRLKRFFGGFATSVVDGFPDILEEDKNNIRGNIRGRCIEVVIGIRLPSFLSEVITVKYHGGAFIFQQTTTGIEVRKYKASLSGLLAISGEGWFSVDLEEFEHVLVTLLPTQMESRIALDIPGLFYNAFFCDAVTP